MDRHCELLFTLLCLGLANVINGGAVKGSYPGSFQQKIVEIKNKGEFVEEVTTKPPPKMPVKVMPAGFEGEEPPETPEVLALGLPSWASLLIYPIDITFSCFGRPYGFYADIKNQCKIYHVCKPVTDGAGHVMRYLRYSFVCPNQTVFDQRSLVCTHEYLAVQCSSSHKYLYVNENFGKQSPGPSPVTSPITRPTGPSSGLRPSPLPTPPPVTTPPECNPDDTGDSPIPCRYPVPTPGSISILVPPTFEGKPDSVIPAPSPFIPIPGSGSSVSSGPSPDLVGPNIIQPATGPGLVKPLPQPVTPPPEPAPGPVGPAPGPIFPAPSPVGPAPVPVAPAPGPVGPAPGPVFPAPGPVGPAPGPVLPVPGPVGPAPGPVAPAPGPIGPAPGPVFPAPGPVGPAPGPVFSVPGPVGPAPGPPAPAPGPVGPAPGPGFPAPGPVGPAPGPGFPAPGPVGPAPGPGFPAPGPVGPAPGPVAPAPGPVGPAPGPGFPAPGSIGPAPGPIVPVPVQVGPSPGFVVPAFGHVGSTLGSVSSIPGRIVLTSDQVGSALGPVVPASDPVGPTPGPIVPATHPVGPTSGPAVPVPGFPGPATDLIYPTNGNVGSATGPVIPVSGQIGPAPGHVSLAPIPVVPALGQVGPAPGPVVPAPGLFGPATAPIAPTPGHVGPAPGSAVPVSAQIGPEPHSTVPTPDGISTEPGSVIPAPSHVGPFPSPVVSASDLVKSTTGSIVPTHGQVGPVPGTPFPVPDHVGPTPGFVVPLFGSGLLKKVYLCNLVAKQVVVCFFKQTSSSIPLTSSAKPSEPISPEELTATSPVKPDSVTSIQSKKTFFCRYIVSTQNYFTCSYQVNFPSPPQPGFICSYISHSQFTIKCTSTDVSPFPMPVNPITSSLEPTNSPRHFGPTNTLVPVSVGSSVNSVAYPGLVSPVPRSSVAPLPDQILSSPEINTGSTTPDKKSDGPADTLLGTIPVPKGSSSELEKVKLQCTYIKGTSLVECTYQKEIPSGNQETDHEFYGKKLLCYVLNVDSTAIQCYYGLFNTSQPIQLNFSTDDYICYYQNGITNFQCSFKDTYTGTSPAPQVKPMVLTSSGASNIRRPCEF